MDSKSTLKSMVYMSILDGIVKDEFKPGQILNEKSLIERFNVSKSPVREALITLCNENVLKNIPRYGYEVVKITQKDVAELLQFRSILEIGCLKILMSKPIDEKKIKSLEDINKLCSESQNSEDMWEHWEYNSKFHLKLISFVGNEFAYNELKKSLDILKRAYAQFYYDKWSEEKLFSDVRYHEKLIDAIKNNDLDLAVTYLNDDLHDFCY